MYIIIYFINAHWHMDNNKGGVEIGEGGGEDWGGGKEWGKKAESCT